MKSEQFHHPSHNIAAFSAVAFAVLSSVACVYAVEPLENAHSHNDYWRARPLTDALDRGFGSVEADVFLVDGGLLVGHAREELAAGKTLESLYLAPLAAQVRENGGSVHSGGKRFYLLIDIKDDAAATCQILRGALSKCSEMLTSVENGKVQPGAVTVVVSGNRPKIDVSDVGPRYAGLDGRVSDLNSDVPAHLMPMISDNWTSQFRWVGNGPMPESERTKLQEIVTKAHAAGRVVRFWATPENEQVWRELRSAGVDLINTDQLDRLAAFLRGS